MKAQPLKRITNNNISKSSGIISFLGGPCGSLFLRPQHKYFLRSPNAPVILKYYLCTGGKEDRLYRRSLMGLSSDEF
jgi:hypothetical protein